MSRVDVIVPCYNYGHYLRQCVESVLSQEGVEVRILIIDDCSPDHTPEVGRALAEQDRRVEYRRHAANRGHILTYNEGLEWASSAYTVLLSADDLLFPGSLARATEILDNRPDIVMVYGRARIHYGPEAPQRELDIQSRPWEWQALQGLDFIRDACARAHNPLLTPTVVVRTRVQRQVGGYRPELRHSGDLEMWLRFAAHGSIGEISTEQAYYRVHNTNMTHRYQGLKDAQQVWEAFKRFFAEYGPRLPESARLELAARQRFAEYGLQHACEEFDRGELRGCLDWRAWAETLDPTIRSHRRWWRLTSKLWIGPRIWSMVRPVVRGARRTKIKKIEGIWSHLS